MQTDTMTPDQHRARTQAKVRDNRARRVAKRRGLRIEKYPTNDPYAVLAGTWHVIRESDGARVATGPTGAYGLSIEQVETFLDEYVGAR